MTAKSQPLRVARVAVPVPLAQLFDYSVPDSLPLPATGARVLVGFGGRQLVAVCVATNPEDPHTRLQPVLRILDEQNFFGPELWSLALWLADYYQYPLGEVLATVLPAAARRAAPLPSSHRVYWQIAAPAATFTRAPRQADLYRRISELGGVASAEQLRADGFSSTHIKALQAKGLIVRLARPERPQRASTEFSQEPAAQRPVLNVEQQAVLDALDSLPAGFSPMLLDGVTGSGKTEVYLRLIERVIDAGRQVLVLVPEIALTPQTLDRFEQRFGTAATVHSNMTDKARAGIWLQAQRGEINILIGTRSAVLTPFLDLGLIVVDEEHDASFKQQDGLRYSARDVAVKRAQQLNIPLLLGSATPSFESLHNARSGRYRHFLLEQRAGGAQMPDFHLIDLRGRKLEAGISDDLQRVISRHLDSGAQVLVFLNRRGYSPTLLCRHCGWLADCAACERHLTMHRTPPALICHHCGRRERVPEQCPSCQQNSLLPVGQGTQRAQAHLLEAFPTVPVYRIDRDTSRSRSRFEEQLRAIHTGAPAILIGTQMLAKGHHFPDVTLVAIINADGGFLSPDFRAPERTAQTIVQVAGRAGRAERHGEVYIQSYQPENPLLQALLKEGYSGFASRELEARAGAGLPPFRPIALVRAEAADPVSARSWLEHTRTLFDESLEVFGPAPSIIPRVADRWRFQLLLSAKDRRTLHHGTRVLGTLAGTNREVRWSLDIDPYDTF